MGKRGLQFITVLVAVLGLMVFNASADRSATAVQVPQVTDLSHVAEMARERQLPILLVFSAHHCAYCELLENEILKPMLISGDYDDRVLIYKIMLDEGAQLRDFTDNNIEADELSHRYNVFVTPTMLFLDADGKELSERLLGINTIEMFGGLVDDAIDLALSKLRSDREKLAGKLPDSI